MELIRKYRKLGWFDFVDIIDLEIKNNAKKEVYLDLLDELRIRKVESISEGATYKLKAKASDLVSSFENRVSTSQSFASLEDLNEFKELARDIF